VALLNYIVAKQRGDRFLIRFDDIEKDRNIGGRDSNGDGICGKEEIFTKVIINKGDSLNDIWQKISLTDDGKYFLETYNPELPILVELQDEAKVNFDNGKFTLNFNGFKTDEDMRLKKFLF